MPPAFERRDPVVTLRNSFARAYDGAIAAARTCYSAEVVGADQVTERQRGSIGPLTFSAGHHTVYQHATFEFGLENVSRHFVWSVLHAFPFYNSDQQSQRYVRQDEIRAFLPPLGEDALEAYRRALQDAFGTYALLSEILKEDTRRIVGRLRRLDRHPHDRIRKSVEREAEKKAIEVARYVLPVATFTSLVYTVSGLVLHRLRRLANAGDLPLETAAVIGKMVEAAASADPDFFGKVGSPPLDRGELPETAFLERAAGDFDPAAWDRELEPYRFARLLEYPKDAERALARSVQLALGRPPGGDPEPWVTLALDPKRNRYRVETLNLSAHSPLMRALDQVHYTFLKRLSHSADSQNQRHRMVTGARPFYQLVDTPRPDFYLPMLIENNGRAREVYEAQMARAWAAKNRLLEMGVPRELALYVLPNALRVRFVESGSLLDLLHKWTQRTCLNAQEEIYHAAMEEVAQVTGVHPFLAPYVGPPCVLRNGVVSPRCTEGDRFCGVPVWRLFPSVVREL